MRLALSLFPGIGLLDSAFEQEGFCVLRGPDVLWGGDIRRFHPPAGPFDGIIGGPPCQTFSSLAHLVRANGHEPRFGNLIPEYERCVAESTPAWFLMENVPAAPEPVVAGYGVKSFLLDNSCLDGGDGMGLEQRRVRRFSFGLRGVAEPPNLLRWIDLAVFVLPDASTVTQWTPDNSQEAKGRTRCEAPVGHGPPPSVHTRRQALVSDSNSNAVPVKIGGSGKVKKTYRAQPVTAGHEQPAGLTAAKRAKRVGAVTGSDGGPSERMGRYKLADACRLQGLPEDFLKDAPFTAEGKLKAVANGVPVPMGRAIARAILAAMEGR